jgi:hypothetical protein
MLPMSGKPVPVSQNTVSGEKIVRKLENSASACRNCGSFRKGGRNKLFRYGVTLDWLGEELRWDNNLFCNLTCRQVFYGDYKS